MQTKIYRYTFGNSNPVVTFQESRYKEQFALEVALSLGLLEMVDWSFQPTYNPYYSFVKNTINNSVVFGIEIYDREDMVRRFELGSDIIGGDEFAALDAAVKGLFKKHQKMLERVQATTAVLLKFSRDLDSLILTEVIFC